MKTNQIILLGLLGSGLALWTGAAQGFSSGSDGSYGPLEVTSNTTLNLPANGIFNCTTISVAQGSTLRFNRNPLNTPVYLLATGDVAINGRIDVSGSDAPASIPDGGLGGPGGFDGGKPGFNTVPPGVGFGPGGGKPGADNNSAGGAGGGGYGSQATGGSSTGRGPAYGSPLLVPLIGGSGGGATPGTPGKGGGGGGGAILIASSTRIDLGGSAVIFNRGGGYREGSGTAYYGPGSGGGVRLVAPVVAGTGQIDVRGGNYDYAGYGRIRVDSIDRRALQLGFVPIAAASVGSTMFVFPTPMPRLDILEAAGTVIAEDHAAPVQIHLPFGSDTNRTVKVQARNFNAVIPIKVVLTPDNGPQISYNAEIDNAAANPAQVTVDVQLPVNVQVTVNAWTR